MIESIDPLVETARAVMSRVAASVEVVTMRDADGNPRGMTVSSLTQVSAESPALLVCIGPNASMRPFFVDGQAFCVNVLSSDQVDLSVGFAFGTEDPFEVFGWSPAHDGTPVLAGTAAHLMCEVDQVVVYNETAVVLASVTGGEVYKNETLVYWMQSYYGDLVPTAQEVQGDW